MGRWSNWLTPSVALEAELEETQDRLTTVERTLAETVARLNQAQAEKRVLLEMIELGVKERVRAALLADRNIILERHNATYQTSVEWAISHINGLTLERGSLIDVLKGQGAGAHPTPTLQWQAADETGPMTPPPGPIQASGVVGGVPIPEGQSAGDVINALRARREREREATPVSAPQIMAEAAALFEDQGEPGAEVRPPLDPFTEIP